MSNPIRWFLALSGMSMVTVFLFRPSGEDRYRRVLAAWESSGEPTGPRDLPLAPGASLSSAQSWRTRAKGWILETGLGMREWSALGRECEEMFVTGMDAEACSSLRSESHGANWAGEPLVKGLLESGSLPRSDARARVDGYLRGQQGEFGDPVDEWRLVALVAALNQRIAMVVCEGGDEGELERLAHLTVELWELRLDAWTTWGFLEYGWASARLMSGLALACTQLGPEACGRLYARLEHVDVQRSLEMCFLRSRVVDHEYWLRARDLGRLPASFALCGDAIDGSPLERWAVSCSDRIEEFLVPEFSEGEHARFLRGAAAAIESLERTGLEPWRPSSVEDQLDCGPFDVGDRLCDSMLRSWLWAYEAAVAEETRRRMALCGLAWAIEGQDGLTRSLERFRSPTTQEPFHVVSDAQGQRLAEPDLHPMHFLRPWPLAHRYGS